MQKLRYFVLIAVLSSLSVFGVSDSMLITNENLINLFHESEDYFFRAISQQCLDFEDSTHAYFTGVHQENLNPVVIRNNAVSVEKVLQRSKIFYELNERPWIVLIPEYLHSQEIEQNLYNIGFKCHEKSTAMVVDLNQQEWINDELLEVKAVDNNLTDWISPLTEAFGGPAITSEEYVDAHKQALTSGARFYHFSVYLDNQPVSSITLSIYQNIARIDDVGTRTAYQRRGYGKYLMKHVLSKAKELGATHCFLEASDSGLELYKKLGFVELFKRHCFSVDKGV